MTTTNVKFPQVRVNLSGREGNAYSIIGICIQTALKGKIPNADILAFLNEAISGDYDHMLATCCEWFTIR